MKLTETLATNSVHNILSKNFRLVGFGRLSGPPGFTCWIGFAPVFSFIYC